MKKKLANYIDHTLLSADSTKDQINRIIDEAINYQFASVCINPYWVDYCYKKLQHTTVKVCTVIGFPLGATCTETKLFETKQAIKDGASEIDMVINIGALKTNNDQFVEQDIRAVVDEAEGKALTKVIIETALLTDEEKVRACELAKQAGADFVKTSTGFSSGGATVSDIQLMRQTVGPHMGIKASGGVRNLVMMNKMIEAGATRIGASAGVDIVTGKKGTSNY